MPQQAGLRTGPVGSSLAPARTASSLGEGRQGWALTLTQRGPVGYQDVDAFGNEVPLLEQRLASREVKAPAIEPGLPAGEEQAVQRGLARVRGKHRKGKQAEHQTAIRTGWMPRKSGQGSGGVRLDVAGMLGRAVFSSPFPVP